LQMLPMHKRKRKKSKSHCIASWGEGVDGGVAGWLREPEPSRDPLLSMGGGV